MAKESSLLIFAILQNSLYLQKEYFGVEEKEREWSCHANGKKKNPCIS